MAGQALLIEQLTTIHRATEALIADLAPDRVIHADSGWRLHDIIGHLAVWYGVRVRALNAWQQGETFILPGVGIDTIDAYNQQTLEERQNWNYSAIRADWQQAFDDLIAAIAALDPAQIDAEITLPWNKPGTVRYLIERMVKHAQAHYDEIEQIAG